MNYEEKNIRRKYLLRRETFITQRSGNSRYIIVRFSGKNVLEGLKKNNWSCIILNMQIHDIFYHICLSVYNIS